MASSRTIPVYHTDGHSTTLETEITITAPFSTYSESDRQLFKLKEAEESEEHHIVTTSSTIFHPQGGGQPSDVGQIKSGDEKVIFDVTSVRQDTLPPATSQVLHLGKYTTPAHFTPALPVTQTIDAQQRRLYSRLHTAGHVLGLAARHYLDSQGLEGVTDGKASHFPGMASVEFVGLIDGAHRAGIQRRLDEYIAADLAVEIHEWDRGTVDAKQAAQQIYLPENGMDVDATGGTLRVVEIVGAGAYPCGGTHVRRTGECGRVSVYKISRQKGGSKLSYRLED